MKKHDANMLKLMVRGAGLIFLGTIFAYLFNFAYRIIVSRYLGPDDYGLLAMGLMVLNIGSIFAFLGLREGIIRYVAYFKGQKRIAEAKGTFYSSLKLTFVISIVVSMLLLLFSGFISNTLFNAPTFKPVLIVFAALLPMFVILGLFGSLFLALKKPGYKELVTTIVPNLAKLILVIIFILLGGAVLQVSLAYLLAIALSVFLAFLLYHYNIRTALFHKVRPVYDYKGLLAFSIPLFFSGVFIRVLGWADTFFLGIFRTTADVGVYNIVFALAASLGMFLTSFGQMFYPLASEMLAKKKHAAIGKLFGTIIRWIFMVTFPIFLLMFFFSKEIIKILFGKEYISGALVLVILLSAYFVNIITGPGAHALRTFGKVKFLLYINLITGGLNMILNVVLISKYGLTGAAIATAISIVLREVIIFVKVKSLICFSYSLKCYFKCIASAIIPMGVVYFILRTFFHPYSLIELAISLVCVGVIYACLLLLFKTFNKADLMIMLSIEKKLGLNLEFIKKILRRFI